ncbi:MAG: MFS transporter [Hyphomicrobiales bacterium]|nr:MFS transporter [Hyphomicrobiales bacterium]
MARDRAIICLAIGQILVWAGLFYVFPAMLVRWEEALGWSKAELTGAFTLAIFVSALSSPVAGRLIDAGRGALMMAGSSLLGGFCLIGMAMVRELWQFYLVWALIGVLLAGCLYEPCFALVTRARGPAARRGIIAITLVAGFASTISFPAIHVLADGLGWRMAIQIFAAVVILVATPFMWYGASKVEKAGAEDQDHSGDHKVRRHAFIGRPQFWLLAVGFGLGAVVHGVSLHHLLPILHDRGFTADTAVLAASFIGPMQVAGRLAMMAAERHVSNHGVAVACFMFMGLAVMLLAASGAVPVLLAGFVVFYGAAYGTVSILRPLIARDILGGANFGAKTGALALIYLVGSASAPYLGSLVWSVGGYDLVLPCLIVLAFAGLILYVAAHRLPREA